CVIIACCRLCSLLSFSFYCSADPRALHSFPTRRSSDLHLWLDDRDDLGLLAQRRVARERVGVGLDAPRCRRAAVHALARYAALRSEEHTSELQSRGHLVCRLLLEKKNIKISTIHIPGLS